MASVTSQHVIWTSHINPEYDARVRGPTSHKCISWGNKLVLCNVHTAYLV